MRCSFRLVAKNLPSLKKKIKSHFNQIAETGQTSSGADSAIGMLMNLRKTANHPLLVIELDEISELLDSISFTNLLFRFVISMTTTSWGL